VGSLDAAGQSRERAEGNVIPGAAAGANISVKSPSFVRGYGFNVTNQSGPTATRCFASYGAELQKQLDEYHSTLFLVLGFLRLDRDSAASG